MVLDGSNGLQLHQIQPTQISLNSTTQVRDPHHLHVKKKLIIDPGAGASGTRASFVHKASSDAGLDVASILGSNYASWVDTSYLS